MARQWLALVPDGGVYYILPGLQLSGQGLPLFPPKAAITDAAISPLQRRNRRQWQLTALAEFKVWVRPTSHLTFTQLIYTKLEFKLIDFLRSKLI